MINTIMFISECRLDHLPRYCVTCQLKWFLAHQKDKMILKIKKKKVRKPKLLWSLLTFNIRISNRNITDLQGTSKYWLTWLNNFVITTNATLWHSLKLHEHIILLFRIRSYPRTSHRNIPRLWVISEQATWTYLAN